MKNFPILAIVFFFLVSCQSTPLAQEKAVADIIVAEQTPEPVLVVEETDIEEMPLVEVEIPLAWNDAVPFGQIGDSAIEVPMVHEERGPYIIPELGPIMGGDKAGPEFFIFINQLAFKGEGHVRGLQYDWWENENDKVHMTLDLTGAEVVVKNVILGDEEGSWNSIWPEDVMYQVFFEFNGSRELTYLEYEYKGQYYYMGKYRK